MSAENRTQLPVTQKKEYMANKEMPEQDDDKASYHSLRSQ
jgi:hypothetical protein